MIYDTKYITCNIVYRDWLIFYLVQFIRGKIYPMTNLIIGNI